MKSKITTYIITSIIILLVIIAIAYPAMFLWNLCLVPALTIAKPIGFLQCIGLIVLFSLMFVKNYSSDKNKN